MPGGYRWMYQLTGLPGWMRFGYSPGWGGLPPGAQFLMESGLWPQFQSWMQSRMPYPAWPMVSPFMAYPQAPGMPASQEVELLKGQAQVLEQQLEAIRKRIEELSGKEKSR
ncbi:MAG: DUF5320 domain-containing protein [Candidatus Acetothermia bacterium]|nr:DUF5320 domain-containing protein [Candidatus Acetothermia bacterium]MDH7505087.1 DUF5320 domain-containing protein [Candidatus Acetothermia bacterium]